MKIILTLILFLIATAASAEPLTATVVYVPGHRALRQIYVRTAVEMAFDDMSRDLGIRIDAVKWHRVANMFDHSYAYESRCARLYGWRDWFDKQNVNTDLRLVILPPSKWADQFFIDGLADEVCKLRTGAAFIEAGHTNVSFSKSFFQAILTVEHEAGHIIGAFHTTGCNMMSTYCLSCNLNKFLPWAPESRVQIRECVEKSLGK
jgi:hypothetical protein